MSHARGRSGVISNGAARHTQSIDMRQPQLVLAQRWSVPEGRDAYVSGVADQTRRSDGRSSSVAEWPVPARFGSVLVLGLGVGALTSVLQTYLDSPWSSLVNAASPWLAPMFVAALLWRAPATAAAVGVAVGLLELVGYYTTAQLRGHPAGHAILLFWAVCAVVGGPIFGLAGWLWRHGSGRLAGAGAAAMGAAFLAEAIVAYGFRLHYVSSLVLFAVIGLGLVVLLGLRRRQLRRTIAWLCITLPAGLVAEIVLGLVYRQTR